MARKALKHQSTKPKQAPAPTFNVADAVDDLRQLVAKAEALASAAEDLFEQVIWVEDGDDRRRLERLAHLVGATAESVRAAVEAGSQLAADLLVHRAGRD
jgi:hypothetical protein